MSEKIISFQKFVESRYSAVSPVSQKILETMSDEEKNRHLTNVWCPSCSAMVEIVQYKSRMIKGDLLLQGKCVVCGSSVATHIECS